jgi:hypothetical protein
MNFDETRIKLIELLISIDINNIPKEEDKNLDYLLKFLLASHLNIDNIKQERPQINEMRVIELLLQSQYSKLFLHPKNVPILYNYMKPHFGEKNAKQLMKTFIQLKNQKKD